MNYLISLHRREGRKYPRPIDQYYIYWGNWFKIHKAGKHTTVFVQLTESEKECGVRQLEQWDKENFDYDDVTGEAIYTGFGDFMDSLRTRE